MLSVLLSASLSIQDERSFFILRDLNIIHFEKEVGGKMELAVGVE